MDQPPQSENPYSSPNPEAAGPNGAAWGDNRVTIEFQRTIEDYVVVEWFRMHNPQTGAAASLKKTVVICAGSLALFVILAIPKRVFANAEEAERFLGWMRAHVPVNTDWS